MARRGVAAALALSLLSGPAGAGSGCALLVIRPAGFADASLRPQMIAIGRPARAHGDAALVPRRDFERILGIVRTDGDPLYGDGRPGAFALSCDREPAGARGFVGAGSMAAIATVVLNAYGRAGSPPPAAFRALAGAGLPS